MTFSIAVAYTTFICIIIIRTPITRSSTMSAATVNTSRTWAPPVAPMWVPVAIRISSTGLFVVVVTTIARGFTKSKFSYFWASSTGILTRCTFYVGIRKTSISTRTTIILSIQGRVFTKKTIVTLFVPSAGNLPRCTFFVVPRRPNISTRTTIMLSIQGGRRCYLSIQGARFLRPQFTATSRNGRSLLWSGIDDRSSCSCVQRNERKENKARELFRKEETKPNDTEI